MGRGVADEFADKDALICCPVSESDDEADIGQLELKDLEDDIVAVPVTVAVPSLSLAEEDAEFDASQLALPFVAPLLGVRDWDA